MVGKKELSPRIDWKYCVKMFLLPLITIHIFQGAEISRRV